VRAGRTTPADASRYRRTETGSAFHSHNLLARLSAAQNVAVASPTRRTPPGRRVADDVDLADKEDARRHRNSQAGAPPTSRLSGWGSEGPRP
jgi:ABC-type lipoprotein export system ATPase subunit